MGKGWKVGKRWSKVSEGIYAQDMEPLAEKPTVKRLDPEYANRKILALKAMLREKSITRAQFDRIKAGIIARVVA